MKTLRFLIVLCFIATFAMNNVNAQNGVIKIEFYGNISGQAIYCTGDIMAPGSYVPIEIMTMQNNMHVKIRDAIVIGLPSGKEYELFQVKCDMEGSNFVNHLEVRCDGKLVGRLVTVCHTTINANGEVTVSFWDKKFICK